MLNYDVPVVACGVPVNYNRISSTKEYLALKNQHKFNGPTKATNV